MLNCSGVRIACHSSSDFCTGPGGGVDDDIADTLGNLRPAAPRDRDTAASPLHGRAALERGTRRSARGVAEAEAEEARGGEERRRVVGGEEEGLHHWDLGVEGKRFGGCDGMEPLSARMTTARRGYRRGRRRRGSHCGPSTLDWNFGRRRRRRRGDVRGLRWATARPAKSTCRGSLLDRQCAARI